MKRVPPINPHARFRPVTGGASARTLPTVAALSKRAAVILGVTGVFVGLIVFWAVQLF